MNSPERPLDPPEETIILEPEFERIPPVQGTLESRVSAMILHISSHNAFDKGDLITLLKDVNKTIRQADDNFKSIAEITFQVDTAINEVRSAMYQGKQA